MNRALLLPLTLLTSLLFLESCKTTPSTEKAVVARVNNAFLYEDDLQKMLDGISGEDSIEFVDDFTRKWVREQVIIQQAIKNIPESQRDFKDEIQRFENSLLIFAYEQQIISQRLDTSVSEIEIDDYYNESKQNFILAQPALRFKYVQTDSVDSKMSQIKELIKKQSPEAQDELKSICIERAKEYFLDDMSWHTMEETLHKIPIPDNLLPWLAKGKTFTIYNNGSAFTFHISGFLPKGNFTPVQMLKDDITTRIVNKRKVELIRKMRNDLFNEALNKKNAEIY